jgi:hypothetical protein
MPRKAGYLFAFLHYHDEVSSSKVRDASMGVTCALVLMGGSMKLARSGRLFELAAAASAKSTRFYYKAPGGDKRIDRERDGGSGS